MQQTEFGFISDELFYLSRPCVSVSGLQDMILNQIQANLEQHMKNLIGANSMKVTDGEILEYSLLAPLPLKYIDITFSLGDESSE